VTSGVNQWSGALLNLKNLTNDKRSSLFRSDSVIGEKEKFNVNDTRRKIRRRVLIVEKPKSLPDLKTNIKFGPFLRIWRLLFGQCQPSLILRLRYIYEMFQSDSSWPCLQILD
jgi:hypothetical protein